ncbi:bifunctional oligoribonuclease/PAP phosphatase NrnA [Bacteroidota bacterium]
MTISESESIIKNINSEIDKCNNITVISHYNPDGDAIGSALALYLLLLKVNKNVNVIIPNKMPDFLKWMEGSNNVIVNEINSKICDDIIINSELFIAVDFNSLDRLSEMGKKIMNSKALKVLIDHHPDPEDFGSLTLSDTKVSSAAELVYEIIAGSKHGELFDKSIAECIYTGIMTDTVNFRHNVSIRTFEILSKLLAKEIDIDDINGKIYDSFSKNRMNLLGYALDKKLTVLKEFNTAFISLTKKELRKFNFKTGDSEGFVNYPLSIEGIKLSVLFLERDKEIKISLRSKGKIKANEIAVKHFNGGGHQKAAGGKSFDTMKNTIKKFENLLSIYKNDLEN